MNRISLRIAEEGRISLRIAEEERIHLRIAGEMYAVGLEDYDGPYEADALFSEQVFPTDNKAMRDDFTVHAINYTEAPNEWGTTLTIGG